MALKLKSKVKAKAPAAPDKPKELTIEEARATYPVGSLELAVAELKELGILKDVAREATNATNRQATKAKGAIKALAQAENLEPTDEIFIGGQAFKYDVAYSDKIDTDAFLKLYEDKKISRDVFLQCIGVAKDKAKLLIGAHVLKNIITENIPGKTFDVRSRDLDNPVEVPRIERRSGKPKPSGNKLRTDVEQAPVAAGGKAKRIRKIGLR